MRVIVGGIIPHADIPVLRAMGVHAVFTPGPASGRSSRVQAAGTRRRLSRGRGSMTLRKVLIANRGEIAVRVARACRDAGLASVAVYADPDRDAPHVRAADEAFALGGDTPATSYLDIGKVLAAAAKSGADAVHPGYGFLSENADFAQAVLDAGLTWIGPPPQAIRDLGDKVAARKIAQRAGAPLVAGTADPVVRRGRGRRVRRGARPAGRDQGGVRRRRPRPEGRPHARGDPGAVRVGGPRGRRRVRPRRVLRRALPGPAPARGDPVPGRRPRQRDRRLHPRLLAAAPPPEAGRGGPRAVPDRGAGGELLRAASKAILREAGYVGAGTCEFLVGQDGTISFLEVNTRLQVEHPVTEEVTGIDLVREMFRIADGEPLGHGRRPGDPRPRGHSIEFRINAEDPGRGFLPAPGTVTTWQPPTGPGVRLDAGVEAGSVIGPAWDSLLGKLIVTGATREQALQRAARALAEFEVGGLATVLPFHRAVVTDPAFAPELHGDPEPFSVHTRWIETEFRNDLAPWNADGAGTEAGRAGRTGEAVVVEVDGKRLEVTLPAGLWRRRRRHSPGAGGQPSASAAAAGGRRALRRRPDRPDAGHRRQGRRHRGPAGQRRRPGRRARGDEDGAAGERPQVRHRHRPDRARRARPSPAAPSSARSRTYRTSESRIQHIPNDCG